MAASGSVFAKQFAGRIRQVGHDGDVAVATGVPKAAVGKASAKAQISAPAGGRQKAASGGGAPAAAKSKAKAAQPKAARDKGDDENEDVEGGVMMCANRDLLRQMLQNSGSNDDRLDDGAGKNAASDDEGEGAFSMSMRIVPGTPKAGTQRRASNVPTITSPSASRIPQSISTAQMRAVSSTAVPSLAPKAVSSASAPSLAPKAVSSASAPSAAPKVKSVPAVKSAMPVPVPKVVTGPPVRENVAPAPPRPGSRGGPTGGAPQSQMLLSPSHRSDVKQSFGTPIGARGVGTPSGGRGSIGTPGSGRAGGSYAGMHAARSKAVPGSNAGGPSAKAAMPTNRPLCGPSAFDMLRKMESSQVLNTEANQCEEGDDNTSNEDGDANGFVMPDDSETSSLDGDRQNRMADLDREDSLVGRPRPAPLSDAKGLNHGMNAKNGTAPESAAEYAERIRRNMGVAPGPADAAGSISDPNLRAVAPSNPSQGIGAGRSREASSSTAARSRSSDPRSSAVQRTADPSGARARSSDARARPSQNCKQPDDSNADDSDSGDEGPVGSSAPWKLDVKSMVKDFAREERARQGGSAPTKPTSKPQAPNRPPKAPPKANAGGGRRAPDVEEEKQTPADSEPIPQGEQLFFSKKPRETEFVPSTIDEYKQKGYANKEYKELKPTLGPDLDDEDLLQKKAIQQRNKEFSKELQRVNKQRLEAAAKQAPKQEPRPEPKATARSKAQEYGRNVPKPKVTASKPLPQERKPKEVDSSKEADLADWEEIRRREKQHFADVLRVKEIKDFLEQLPQ